MHRGSANAVIHKGLDTLSDKRGVVKQSCSRQMSGRGIREKGRVSRDLETTQRKADKSC